jgi:hypothetical protein
MNKVGVLFIVSMFFTYIAVAQDTTTCKHKIGFYSAQQVALLVGENALRPAFNLNVGATYRNVKLGIGASVNTYFTTTVPLYVDMRYTLQAKNVSPFVFVNTGFNTLAYALNNNNNNYNEYKISKRNPGSYVDAGAGFRVKVGNSLYYTSSLSWCYKKAVFMGQRNWGWWPSPGGEEGKYVIENKMIILRAGFEF